MVKAALLLEFIFTSRMGGTTDCLDMTERKTEGGSGDLESTKTIFKISE